MLSGQEWCENHPSLIPVTVSGNVHLGPGQFRTLSTFRPRCRGEDSHLIHTMCMTGTSQLFALGAGQGGEGGGQGPTTSLAISLQFHISFVQSKMPQLCWTMWKKNLQRLLFCAISHRRKELRLSNLIHLGLLCLNPRSKVFNQLRGDRGRRLCVGSPGCRRVGEGQRGRQGAELWSVTELPPSPRGADQALLHSSFQECKAAYACRSSRDTNDN